MKTQLKDGDIIIASFIAVKLRFVEHEDMGYIPGTNYGRLVLVDKITDLIEQDKIIIHPDGGDMDNSGIEIVEDADLDSEADERFMYVYSHGDKSPIL